MLVPDKGLRRPKIKYLVVVGFDSKFVSVISMKNPIPIPVLGSVFFLAQCTGLNTIWKVVGRHLPVAKLRAVLHQISGRFRGFPGCGRCCGSSEEGGETYGPQAVGGAVAALREEEKLMVPRLWAVLHQLSERRTDIPVSRLWAVRHQLSRRRRGKTYPFPGCGRCCTSSREGRGGGGRLTRSQAAGGAVEALGKEEGGDLPVHRLRAMLYQLSERRLTGSQTAGGAAPALGEQHGLSDHGRAGVEVSRLVSRLHGLLLPGRVT